MNTENRKADANRIQKMKASIRGQYLPKYMTGRVEVEPVSRPFHYEEQPITEHTIGEVEFKRVYD